MKYDAIIIGGGAAGLFCAITAGKRGRRILVIEHNAEVGRKIILSGGGRCNFTNIHSRPENFISANPHFCKSALARYTPSDFVDLVKKHRIEYYEKKLGQLFCRERSDQIVEMLLAECGRAGVRIVTGCSVESVAEHCQSNPILENKPVGFMVETNRGNFHADGLVIATGGLSFPKVGATDLGYKIARQFGLGIVQTRPSLVPLVFAERGNFGKLAGLSIDTRVSVKGQAFRENILFTHRGLSGPATLQISNYWDPKKPISIDLLPDVEVDPFLDENRESGRMLDNFISEHLPRRFAEQFVEKNFRNRPLNQIGKKELTEIGAMLCEWKVEFSGTEGYDKAEVTLGGVSTNEIDSRTMEAKKMPGLFFIGEVVDVTGWLGGYNFQWAWSSGYAAGNSV